tara:strand:+ start:225 stop:416 length:192 start_codon:yes stop_codon:yes gene_type:complete
MITHRVTITEITKHLDTDTAPAFEREVFRQEFTELNLSAIVRVLNKPARRPRKGKTAPTGGAA